MILDNLFGSVCQICGVKKFITIRYEDGTIVCTDCLYIESKDETHTNHHNSRQNWNKLVTPKTFDDYIGQDVIKKELKTMLAATKIHGIPVQHTLFSGSFGLGKTTIANIFAENVAPDNYAIITATSVKNEDDFPPQQVVVVDEIHTIQREEWLLGIMDRGNQTILGATTTAGSLSGPLRSRFVSLVLQPYTTLDLVTIITNAAKNLDYDCPSYLAEDVANRGKAVARISLFLFKRIYDRITLNNYNVNKQLLDSWFKEMDIDPYGLDNADRAYLNCLSDKPVGLQYLSAVTGMDKETVIEAIEPYLLVKGFIKRTPRGRILGDNKPIGIWK